MVCFINRCESAAQAAKNIYDFPSREADLNLNYGIGKTLIINPDSAPPPFDVPGLDDNIPPGSYPEDSFEDDINAWSPYPSGAGLEPLSFVYNRFPRGHPTWYKPRPVMSDATKLLIIGVLSRKTDTGAQVLVCRVKERGLNVNVPDVVVVKDYIEGPRQDFVAAADMAYAHEVAAYERFGAVGREPDSTLRRGFQPAYYGSWYHEAHTTSPNFKHRTRPVRLIVMEKIDGISLADMCMSRHSATAARGDRIYPVNFNGNEMMDPEIGVYDVLNVDKTGDKMEDWMQRMRIINDLADGLVRQSHMGVSTNTISPTQVIIQAGLGYQCYPGPLERPGPRVVLVDYSSSITTSWTKRGTGNDKALPAPRSPRGNSKLVVQLRELCGWWPAEWRYNTNLSIWFRKFFPPSAEYTIEPDNWGIETRPAASLYEHPAWEAADVSETDENAEDEDQGPFMPDRSSWTPFQARLDEEIDWLAPSESKVAML